MLLVNNIPILIGFYVAQIFPTIRCQASNELNTIKLKLPNIINKTSAFG